MPVQRSQSARVASAVGPAGGFVDREGFRKEPERLRVGVVLERPLAGPAQVFEGLVRHARPAPVVGEQRDEWLQVRHVRLVPLGDRSMERAALRVDEQVVGDLLGDDVGEQVGEVGIGRLEAGQVEACGVLQLSCDRADACRPWDGRRSGSPRGTADR